MSRQFDEQQKQVLDSCSQHQLVSASAGSGKTTVMIQKITDLLLNGTVNIDELLVVTFTNLASVEMRERLTKNILSALTLASNEDEKLRIQTILDSIQTASIDTIDGFCSKMLKKYFYQANIDPEIKIISSFSQEYYINKALDMAINKFNQQDEKSLLILCDIFEKKSRNLDSLKENLLKAFNYCICQKDYKSFLNIVLAEYNDLNSPSSQYLNKYIYNSIHLNLNNLLQLIPMFTDFPKLHKMLDTFSCHLLNIKQDNRLMNNVEVLTSCPNCNFSSTERVDKNDYNYQKLKYNVENLRNVIAETKFLSLIDENHLPLISSNLSSFITLLTLFIDIYDKLKRENNVIDFADLERKMLDLLTTDEIINDLHNTYKYVFVDEYQDINPMQDELISAILSSSSNLFLVGDVKQSIYGFRQSTPELFIKTYKDYKNNSNLGTAFDMNINFRSAPQILKFNNEIFSHLMTEQDTDIDYAGTSQFEPKRDDFPDGNSVEIMLANTDIEEENIYASGIYSVNQHINPTRSLDAHELEAQLVVQKIQNLVGTPFYNSNTKQEQNLKYSDIAILSRGISNDRVQNLAKLLTQHGIPININKRSNLQDSEAIAKVLSILRILNNTGSDIDYTYIFTSPLCKITYNELLNIYTDKQLSLYENLQYYINNYNDNLSIKIKYGFNLISEWLCLTSTLSVVELIKTILNKYHLRQHLIASDKGYEQINILDEFLDSLSVEEKKLPISKFIDVIERNLDTSNEIIARDSLNSVTIQTIHASKGLEYPIVFLFNSGQQFKYITEHNELNFDLDLGIGMQYYDLNLRKRYESPTRYAIKLKNREKSYKEELRLLYVATTRAKNKLIITGCCSEEKLKSNTLTKDNYLNLILSTYYSKINTQPLSDHYKFANCDIKLYVEAPNLIANNCEHTKQLANDENITQKINYVYPYMQETNISIKNNVTALSRTLNEEYNIVPVKLNLAENLNANNDDLAQIGTMYHNALANINYCKPFINQSVDAQISPQLLQMAYSKLSPIAYGCINQYNEKQFMMYVPYNEIYPESNVDTKILIQGVIDLIFEFDDHIVLIDYKYSNSSIDTLTKKYNTQIKLYKMALEKAYKKPVTDALIYSIKSGETKSI